MIDRMCFRLVTAVLLFACSALAQNPPVLPSDVVTANQELDRRLLEAHAKKDTAAVLALFSSRPDIFFIAPNGVVNKGREQIRQSYDRFFDGLEAISAEIKDVAYLPQGDGVIAVGTVIFHRKPKNGGQSDDRTVVWTDFRRVENGKWVYLFRHAHWPLVTPQK